MQQRRHQYQTRRQHLSPLIFMSPRVGAAAGGDLLILIFNNKIKRLQPSAAPTVKIDNSNSQIIDSRCVSSCLYCKRPRRTQLRTEKFQ
jgi:hypothetical protein